MFENRGYIAIEIILSLFYFANVFIGMLLLYSEYEKEGPYQYHLNEEHYTLMDRSYDIIEVILLGLILLDTLFKVVFASKAFNAFKVVR